jgi:hypothetical protein
MLANPKATNLDPDAEPFFPGPSAGILVGEDAASIAHEGAAIDCALAPSGDEAFDAMFARLQQELDDVCSHHI